MPGDGFDEVRREILSGTAPGFESRFTVDWTRAGQILSRYQLANPYAYILKWVQWAVRSGATEVRVTVASGGAWVEHDGITLDLPSDLSTLFGSGDHAHMHLSIGCYAALRLKPTALVLQSGRHEEVLHGRSPSLPRRLLPNRIAVTGFKWDVPSLDGVGLLLQSSMEPSPGRNFFGDLKSVFRPESALVRSHAAYAPIPVWLNGRPVNRPFFGVGSRSKKEGDHLRVWPSLWLQISAEHYQHWSVLGHGPLALPGRMPVGNLLVVRGESDTPRPWPLPQGTSVTQEPVPTMDATSMWGRAPRLWLWDRPAIPYQLIAYCVYRRVPAAQFATDTTLEWAKDGVIVEREKNPKHVPPGIRAVLSATDIPTDLSQFKLVRDEAYRNAIERLVSTWRLTQ